MKKVWLKYKNYRSKKVLKIQQLAVIKIAVIVGVFLFFVVSAEASFSPDNTGDYRLLSDYRFVVNRITGECGRVDLAEESSFKSPLWYKLESLDYGDEKVKQFYAILRMGEKSYEFRYKKGEIYNSKNKEKGLLNWEEGEKACKELGYSFVFEKFREKENFDDPTFYGSDIKSRYEEKIDFSSAYYGTTVFLVNKELNQCTYYYRSGESSFDENLPNGWKEVEMEVGEIFDTKYGDCHAEIDSATGGYNFKQCCEDLGKTYAVGYDAEKPKFITRIFRYVFSFHTAFLALLIIAIKKRKKIFRKLKIKEQAEKLKVNRGIDLTGLVNRNWSVKNIIKKMFLVFGFLVSCLILLWIVFIVFSIISYMFK